MRTDRLMFQRFNNLAGTSTTVTDRATGLSATCDDQIPMRSQRWRATLQLARKIRRK